MIERNAFGKIEPRIGKYFVRKNSKGKYEVLENDYNACMTASVSTVDNPWVDVDSFDSMVQAYTWLKANVQNLL